jgi:conjugal transfer ATP-binding protein TraC
MDPKKRHAALFNKDRFADLVPVNAYDEEEGLFFIDGDREYLGAMFLGSPLIGADDGTTAMIKSAMSGDIPDDTLIQISYLSTSYIESMVRVYSKTREDILRRSDGLMPHQKEVLHGLFVNRRKFLLDGAKSPIVKSSGVRLKDTMLLLSIKVPLSKTPNERELEDVRAAVMRFSESFKSVGLSPLQANAAMYLGVLRTILFMGEAPSTAYDDDQLIREQVFPYSADMEVEPKHVRINDTYIRSLSTQNYPDMVSLGVINQLIGDPNGSHNQIVDPFMLTLTVHFPQQAKAVKNIKAKQNAINYQAQGPWAKYVARIRVKQEGHEILDEAMENGNRPCKLWFNAMIFSRDADDAARSASSLRTHFQMHGFEMHEDKHMHAPFFLMQLPLFPEVESVEKSFRYYTMTVAQAAQLPPVIGEWKGSGRRGALVLAGRRGQIMLYDLFDSQTNYNLVIAAESGAGKSFLANDVIVGYLQKGAKVRVIDQGRSYEKLCESIDGEYIEFDDQHQVSLNPFTHVKDIDEEMDLLSVIIAKMASPTSGFNDWEISQTVVIIKELWDEFGSKTTITDVAERFLHHGQVNNNDQRLINIGQQLFQFTRHGTYGKYFDGPNTLDYNNNLVVLELDNLRAKRDLQQVVMLQLIAQLQTECYLGDRNVPKCIVIDEAWDLFEDPMVAKFLEGAYRRFRKYNSACVVVTQSLDDLYASASGDAIAKNSANVIVLRQNSEAIEGLYKSERFKIGEYGFNMLRSLHTERGQYSDMLLRQGEAWGVARFVVDRYTQLLYSTSPDDVMAIQALRDRGMSVKEAIEHIMRAERGEVDPVKIQPKRKSPTEKERLSA